MRSSSYEIKLAIVAVLCASTGEAYGTQTVIRTAADLQSVSSNMATDYVLGGDIDLSGITNFIPIGAPANANPIPFTGAFDGAGHTITGLAQVSTGQYTGLFGLIGSGGVVTNLRLQNALITSNYGGGSASAGNPIPGMIGILAGENDHGTINNVTVNGAIVTTSPGSAIGGFVGVNIGTVSNSSASMSVTATLNDSDTGLLDQSTQIGGIAGRNDGVITNVSAAGTISVQLSAAVSARAVFGAQIGGLIGLSDSAGQLAGSNSSVNITAAFSGSGFATSADNPYTAYWNAIGGLVGNAPGPTTIANSFSTGSITITDAVKKEGGQPVDTVGGLLGSGGIIGAGAASGSAATNINPAGTPTITGSYASGPIQATDLCCAPYGGSLNAGGLVGVLNGTIVSSYASGSVDVTGEGYNGVGGLVAQLWSGTLTDVKASGAVTSVNMGTGNDVGGLAGTAGGTVTGAIASGSVVSRVTATVPTSPGGFTSIDSTVGGLVGFNHGVIKNAIALGSVTANFAGSVSGSGSSYNDQAAGLVANSSGSISNSSASGAVSLTSTVTTSNGGTTSKFVGGLVGGGYRCADVSCGNAGGVSSVVNSFSTGAVSVSGVNDRLFAGSLMGYNDGSLSSSYATGKVSTTGGNTDTIGGLVGRNDAGGSVASSYWDANLTGVNIGVGSGTKTGATSWVGAPTSIPTGFDPAIWGLAPTVGNGYPYLLWESAFLNVPGCSYSLSSGGQVFGPSFVTGTISITAPPGCPWSVGPVPSWIMLTSPSSGFGNGTVTFQVLQNAGGDLSGSFTIAGENFTVEQEGPAPPGLAFIGSMPHLPGETGWNTILTFVNKGTTSAIARTNLFASDGTALTLPVGLPQQTAISGPLFASTLDQTINPNASFIIQAAGLPTSQTLEGSAQLAANGRVDGFAIFHYNPTNQEAVVPMETINAPSYLLAFDNTNNVATGVALGNISRSPASIPVTIRDDAGTLLTTGSVTLNGEGHTSFVLSTRFPQTANIRGTIEIDTPSGGQISALGIRYTPPGTTTTIPALAEVGTTGGSMAHIAVGNGWETTFALVNTGASAATANLAFFDKNGNPLPLPLAFPQTVGGTTTTAATYSRIIAANASLWVQSTEPLGAAYLEGSARLTTSGNISGFVIFRYTPNGQEAVVPLESRNAGSYLVAYDNTGGTATGIALSTLSTLAVQIPVTLRDDTGNVLTTGSILLNASGHTSFVLSQIFPQTASVRGTAEFEPPLGTTISVLGIRSPPALTFTTLPALAK